MNQTATQTPIAELAAGIIASLGDGWYVKRLSPERMDPNRYAVITSPSGAEFGIHRNWAPKAGQLHISIEWPRDAKNGYYKPYSFEKAGIADSINVSETKSPAQMAGDIRRRLYTEPLIAAWLDRKAQADGADRYRSNGYQMAVAIAEAFGLQRPEKAESRHNDQPADTFRLYVHDHACEVTGSGLKLDRLYAHTAEAAIDLLHTLKAWSARHPKATP